MTRSRAVRFALVCGVACLPLLGSANGRVEAACDRAVDFFAKWVWHTDPSWKGLVGYLRLRFGVELKLASGAPVAAPAPAAKRSHLEAIYRRLDDPDATVSAQAIAGLPSITDRMTANALHCDRIPLPANWSEILERAGEAGGLALTHAALASVWTVENGCLPQSALREVQHDLAQRLVRLVEARRAPDAQGANAVDLWIEAVAMLYYLGAGERVQAAWIEDVLALQRPDGGWPLGTGSSRSDPHATVLALWVLLEHRHPEIPRTPWIQPRS